MKYKGLLLLLAALLGMLFVAACSSQGAVDEQTIAGPAATIGSIEAPDEAAILEPVADEVSEEAGREASNASGSDEREVAAETASEPEDSAPSAEKSEEPVRAALGTVDFPISCNAAAQAEFDHGLAALHAFWIPAALESFEAAAALDPTCAMAYWGLAMSHLGIPWNPTPPDRIALGQAAVDEALALGAPSDREQGYIDAIATFYQDAETLDYGTRALAYEAAMAQLAQDFPDDSEAQLFYALALLITASPTDTTYANQLRATEIVEPIFAGQPNHPGAAHYLIHSHDATDLAADGVEAAARFAEIAPAAPHALHMPSHIFTRRGYWQDSIAANTRGVAATNAALGADSAPGTALENALHGMDYMMYAYLQLAQDDAARAMVDEIRAIKQVVGGFGAAYALAAIPARYVLERGAWEEAATLTLSVPEFAWQDFPQAEAIIVFARGLSAARLGDVAAGNEAVEQLQALQETLTVANQGYWAGQVGIQIEEIAAWIALAEGDAAEALATMRHATELEAATEKHPVTPGPVLPAYELLGAMLLELDDPNEALSAFEASLHDDPNRFGGLYGAARAAELAGDTARAEAYYRQLVELAATAGGERPEVAQAAEFLARQ